MNKTTKKVLSLVLMIVMILSSVPMTSFAANILCATGHKYGDYVVTKAATCSAKGTETATCTRISCGVTTTREVAVDPAAHAQVNVAAKAAECEKAGNTEGVVCSLCDAVIRGYTILPATGHTSVALAAKDATCVEDGHTAGTKCKDCGDFLTGGVKIEAKGHSWSLYSQKPADCKNEDDGERINICLNCSVKSEPIKIEYAHSYGNWVTTTQATCDTDGSMYRICTVSGCGHRENKTIEKKGHTEVSVSAVPATCTTDGMTAGKKCSVVGCEKIVSGCERIPATNHQGTTVVTAGVAPTCDTKGKSESSYCSACGAVLAEERVINALGHAMVKDETKSKDPTCTQTGSYVEKCTRAGCTYTTTEVLPIIHKADWTTVTRETCTTDGKERGVCENCGMDVIQVRPALGHKVVNAASWKVSKAATCTADGQMVVDCVQCDGQATKVIEKTGHTEVVYKAAVAATCEKEGSTESKRCSVCKTVTVPAQIVPKAEHTFGAWTVEKSATCAAAGVEKAVCSACKKEELRTIDRLPHKEQAIAAVDATCTTDGSTAGITCTECGAKVKEVEVIKALGHDYIEDTTKSKAPTCTEAGNFYGTCSRCKDVKDEALTALGHTEEVIPGTPADCINSGVSDGKKCTVCQVITVEKEALPALGHDFVLDTEKTVPATCIEKGLEYYSCSRCKVVEDREVAPLDHTWGEWEVTTEPSCDTQGEKKRVCTACNTVEDEKIDSLGGHEIATLPGEDATCTTPGKTNGSYCSRCNTVFEPQEEIEALGHDFEGVEPTFVKATTEREGSYARHCKVCDGTVDPQIIPQIDAASIKLSTEKCTYNGKKRTPSVSVKDVNGNDLVEGVDFEVEYASGRKNPGEYPITVTFTGNYEGTKTLIFTIAAGKTTKITATSSQKSYVKLTWNEVEGATGYRVYVYKTVDGKTRKKVASVEGTSYNLTKDYAGKALKVGTEYKIAIVAYTKLDDGTVIHALAGVAKTFKRTPGKPSLTVTSASGKANLKWTNVADETAYQVYYSTSKDGTYKKLATGLTAVSYSKAFTKGKTIYFKVRAYAKVDGEVVYGSFSSVKSVVIK